MATYIDALMVGFGLDPKEFIEGTVTVGKASMRIAASTKKDFEEMERAAKKELRSIAAEEKAAAKEAEAAHKRIVAAHEKTSQSLDTLIRNFLKLAALFTAGAGISSFVSQITAADSALGRLASSIGEAPADISAIANAVERGGGSADAAAASFKRLSQGIQEIKIKGDGALRQPLLEIQAAGGKRLDLTKAQVDVWADIADNMKAINDKQGAAQATFFGEQAGFDEGTINLLRQGGAAFRKAMADSKAFGIATKEDTDAAQKLQTALVGLKQQSESFGRTIVTLVSPAVTDLLKQFQDWIVAHKDLIQTKIKEFVDGLAEALKGIDWPGVITGLRDFFKGVNDAAQAVGGWKVVAEAFFALWVSSKFLNVLTALGSLRLALLGLTGLGPLGWGAAGLAALGIGLAAADPKKSIVHGGSPSGSMNPGDELPGVDSSENRRPGIFARARRAVAKRLGLGGGEGAGAGSPRGTDKLSRGGNAQAIIGELRKAGYNDNAIAAVVGSMQTESGLNPAVPENSYNHGHHGLWQWDSRRWPKIKSWIEGQGGNPYDAAWQTKAWIAEHTAKPGDAIYDNSNTERGGAILKGNPSLGDAVHGVRLSERFGPGEEGGRAANAQNWLPRLSAPAQSAPAGTSPNGAPLALKPNSMPNAPGVTMDEANRQRVQSAPAPAAPARPATGGATFAPTLQGIQAFRESSMWRGIGGGAGGVPDTGRMLAQAQLERFASNSNTTNTTTNSTVLNGGVQVTTNATDADGIARDMEGALKRRNFAQSANYGSA